MTTNLKQFQSESLFSGEDILKMIKDSKRNFNSEEKISEEIQEEVQPTQEQREEISLRLNRLKEKVLENHFDEISLQNDDLLELEIESQNLTNNQDEKYEKMYSFLSSNGTANSSLNSQTPKVEENKEQKLEDKLEQKFEIRELFYKKTREEVDRFYDYNSDFSLNKEKSETFEKLNQEILDKYQIGRNLLPKYLGDFDSSLFGHILKLENAKNNNNLEYLLGNLDLIWKDSKTLDEVDLDSICEEKKETALNLIKEELENLVISIKGNVYKLSTLTDDSKGKKLKLNQDYILELSEKYYESFSEKIKEGNLFLPSISQVLHLTLNNENNTLQDSFLETCKTLNAFEITDNEQFEDIQKKIYSSIGFSSLNQKINNQAIFNMSKIFKEKTNKIKNNLEVVIQENTDYEEQNFGENFLNTLNEKLNNYKEKFNDKITSLKTFSNKNKNYLQIFAGVSLLVPSLLFTGSQYLKIQSENPSQNEISEKIFNVDTSVSSYDFSEPQEDFEFNNKFLGLNDEDPCLNEIPLFGTYKFKNNAIYNDNLVVTPDNYITSLGRDFRSRKIILDENIVNNTVRALDCLNYENLTSLERKLNFYLQN